MDAFVALIAMTVVAIVELGVILVLAARVQQRNDTIKAGRFGPQHYWPGGRQHER